MPGPAGRWGAPANVEFSLESLKDESFAADIRKKTTAIRP
ncbi:MAG: cyclodeaminase/cyclohydrolase family protein [Acidobacteriota bacterium]|nr:cyclodeaminase/cyclohydrolase family protein [Acidobacteriota bacterium]